MNHTLALEEYGFSIFETNSQKSMIEIASNLGDIFKVETMPLVQTLTPRLKVNENDNTYSGNFGLNNFPYHTDLAHWYIPPRYILLRCVNPVKNVATKLIDKQQVLEHESKELINRALFLPRKRLDKKANLLKIMNGGLFRWDSLFIKPANNAGKVLKENIENRVKNISSKKVFLNKAGESILIDNWRMLHARGSIDERSMHRKIERIYFQ